MRARGFSETDFASLHPGGTLGRRLSHVEDHMHAMDKLVTIGPDADFHKILEAVTKNFGIVGVLDAKGVLVGAVSDGDLRRALVKLDSKALATKASDLMTRGPKNVPSKTLAIDALTLMNDRQITQLFVMSPQNDGKLAGVVRLHDLLAAKIL
jgi:arabinose-5-phosphate isomerase